MEEESIIVDKAFKAAKSAVIKKLRLRTAESVGDLSEKRITRITGKKLSCKVHNAGFRNKAVPCPVQAKHVQSHHQVDLVDMQKCPVEWKRKLYKYILPLMDVFSRYHWLKPSESKSSRAIACALKSIYTIHRPPERLQSDNGGEFKGRTLEFCKRQKIKPIYSRPYHPQSQGKVEQSHRELRYLLLKKLPGILQFIYIYKEILCHCIRVNEKL